MGMTATPHFGLTALKLADYTVCGSLHIQHQQASRKLSNLIAYNYINHSICINGDTLFEIG